MTKIDGFSEQDPPPDGGGVQDVQGGSDCGCFLQDVTPGDGDGFHVKDHQHDNVGDKEEQFLGAEGVCSFDDGLQNTNFFKVLNSS